MGAPVTPVTALSTLREESAGQNASGGNAATDMTAGDSSISRIISNRTSSLDSTSMENAVPGSQSPSELSGGQGLEEQKRLDTDVSASETSNGSSGSSTDSSSSTSSEASTSSSSTVTPTSSSSLSATTSGTDSTATSKSTSATSATPSLPTSASEHIAKGYCLYRSGKSDRRRCTNPRSYKSNGKLHTLCETHRLRQNAYQRNFDRKQKRKRVDMINKGGNNLGLNSAVLGKPGSGSYLDPNAANGMLSMVSSTYAQFPGAFAHAYQRPGFSILNPSYLPGGGMAASPTENYYDRAQSASPSEAFYGSASMYNAGANGILGQYHSSTSVGSTGGAHPQHLQMASGVRGPAQYPPYHATTDASSAYRPSSNPGSSANRSSQGLRVNIPNHSSSPNAAVDGHVSLPSPGEYQGFPSSLYPGAGGGGQMYPVQGSLPTSAKRARTFSGALRNFDYDGEVSGESNTNGSVPVKREDGQGHSGSDSSVPANVHSSSIQTSASSDYSSASTGSSGMSSGEMASSEGQRHQSQHERSGHEDGRQKDEGFYAREGARRAAEEESHPQHGLASNNMKNGALNPAAAQAVMGRMMPRMNHPHSHGQFLPHHPYYYISNYISGTGAEKWWSSDEIEFIQELFLAPGGSQKFRFGLPFHRMCTPGAPAGGTNNASGEGNALSNNNNNAVADAGHMNHQHLYHQFQQHWPSMGHHGYAKGKLGGSSTSPSHSQNPQSYASVSSCVDHVVPHGLKTVGEAMTYPHPQQYSQQHHGGAVTAEDSTSPTSVAVSNCSSSTHAAVSKPLSKISTTEVNPEDDESLEAHYAREGKLSPKEAEQVHEAVSGDDSSAHSAMNNGISGLFDHTIEASIQNIYSP